MGSADVGGHPPSDWAMVHFDAWQHYHERMAAIEREFLGRWSAAPEEFLDPVLAQVIEQERSKLRAEMRAVAPMCHGIYPVPIYP